MSEGNGSGKQCKSSGLTPWKKGQSGNPSGRRKGGVSLAASLARSLTPQTAGAIVKKLLKMAKDGDINAIKLVLERIDGKPTENIQATVTLHGMPEDLVKAIQDRAAQKAKANGNGTTDHAVARA